MRTAVPDVELQGTFIALLRGINVGGRAPVRMADLRALCESIGWREARTCIQSGNVVFRASHSPRILEQQLESAIYPSFGIRSSVIVRGLEQWSHYIQANPFPAESLTTPNRVMLALSQKPPARKALIALRERAGSELIERVGETLWIYYPEGAGKSRLTPGAFDQTVGSPTTTRNWRTVLKIAELANA